MSQAWSANTPPALPPLRPVTPALAAVGDAAAEQACASASDECGVAGGHVTESFSVETAADNAVEGPGNGVQADARVTLDGLCEREVIVQCDAHAASSLAASSEDAARQTSTPSDYAVETPVVASAALPAAAATCDDEFVVGGSGRDRQTCDFLDFNMQRTGEGPNQAAYADTVTVPLVGLHWRAAATAHAARAVYNDEPPPATSPFLNLRAREVRCEVMLCRCS